MPQQEFPPPRPPARSYRPGRDEEEPPPWANLPPVRPVRSRGPVPGGRHGADGGHPADPGPRQDEEEAAWAQWAGRETDDDGDAEEEMPSAAPRGPRRSARAAARRRRRWLVMAGGAMAAAAAVLTVVLLTGGRPAPAQVTPGALITTFQPGELRQVPQACTVVPGGTVQQYLPGQPKVASPLPVNGSAESACNWTIDNPPVYRLMQLDMLAYAPNGLASGDGSATFAAMDAYDQALHDMQAPPRNSPAPRATVHTLSGLGNQAFTALQVFHVGGAVTDVATVMIRYHNVVVTVRLNGLEYSSHGSYGPVSPSQLASAALAFAQAAEASLR